MYLDRDSFVHRLDPRTKIAGMLCLSTCSLAFTDPAYVGVIALLSLLIGAVSGSLTNFWRLRYLLALQFLIGTLLWPFFVTGPTTVWHWGSIALSVESVRFGLAMAFRLSSMLMVGITFLSTTRIEEFTYALARLRVPYPVTLVISLTFRIAPSLGLTALAMTEAQRARGLELETRNPLRRARRFVPLVAPVFLHALRRVNVLSMALEARGFRPMMRRTAYIDLRLTPADFLVLLALIALTVLTFLARIHGYGVVALATP
jgi:energy-coupling factor transport system permease protein